LDIYRTTRCLALSAFDSTFSLRSFVTTLVVVVVVVGALLVVGFVVFLALAVAAAVVVVAAAAAVVSFFLAEAEASFFGPILKGGDLKQIHTSKN
jgi:hypothetical protein